MKVGFVQMDVCFGRVEQNLRKAEQLLEPVEADLWVLPELFSSGYLFTSPSEAEALSEPIPEGPTTQFLLRMARKKKAVFAAGVAERAGEKIYNAAVLIDSHGVQAVYRKVHLFNEEKKWFTAGDNPFFTIMVNGIRFGLMICFDWFFPEAMRSLALQGAEIICHPANLVLPYCQNAMVTRCLENRVFAITANRIGIEERGGKRLAFTGDSRITAPDGVVLAQGGEDERAVCVEIDPAAARKKAVTPLNDLFADRRPECYRL